MSSITFHGTETGPLLLVSAMETLFVPLKHNSRNRRMRACPWIHFHQRSINRTAEKPLKASETLNAKIIVRRTKTFYLMCLIRSYIEHTSEPLHNKTSQVILDISVVARATVIPCNWHRIAFDVRMSGWLKLE